MDGENLNDLHAFLAVAQERSFTRAAARLGLSQSTLSHTVRGLESRLGVRLLTRTTRSVAPTEAGEQLMQGVGPMLEAIGAELAAVREYRDKPAGTIRITAIDIVADHLLWPRLRPLLKDYPELRIEIATDYRLVDVVSERFDVGVRLGDQVAQDMVAVRIGPEMRAAIAASPAYLAEHGTPSSIEDLARHQCITLRLTSGAIYAWELLMGGKVMPVKVDGQVTFTSAYQMMQAAIDGCGLVFVTEDALQPHVDAGRLAWVMEDHWPTWPGWHIYYPSRRESSRALKLVIDALRHPRPSR
ncbi:MAG: LysR family transcriptional regulator [Ottowia sp.]|uniref:LysR family transcriptional regulator n=1 Tax=Ottowia sp. TaxID=1898956 RepID=UPI001DF0B76B|nr:LysR family transcriptional regulator [Ottowia sp.]HPR08191.1 LysR family transcriptional regulator [Denitromonas sp.]MCB2026183.1 LysR family transcriptional regulator [Ottowia sp.]MCB2034709.1 LysR family transcriptional regulator [Ottowia sp.]MCB2037190.1 LysR family transcriptional regulator [Ottowia sp.]MCB2068320.1 LysR family transcriptional regulator [Ottowia sp.]